MARFHLAQRYSSPPLLHSPFAWHQQHQPPCDSSDIPALCCALRSTLPTQISTWLASSLLRFLPKCRLLLRLSLTACLGTVGWVTRSWVTCPLPIPVVQRPRLMEQPLSQVVPVDRPDGNGRHWGLEGLMSAMKSSVWKSHMAPSTHNSLLWLTTRDPGSTVQLHMWKGGLEVFGKPHTNGYTNWILSDVPILLLRFTPLHNICYYLTYFCVLTVCGHVGYIA